MSILDTIYKHISVSDYENCWAPSVPPASFERFAVYLSTALQKQLPADIADFEIGIESRETNRVQLRGSFISESIRYTLYGAIVYLPAMDTFRGRPGFNRCYAQTYDVDELSENPDVPRRTLGELADAVFLESQNDSFPKAVVLACRDALSRTVNELIRLEGDPRAENKESTIRRCVEAINQSNRLGNECIDTELREELVELLLEISIAAGLQSTIADRIDEWREW